ncbi:T9SS type A sorting domain-containing protein [Gillisia limnaea]|uniref:Immunoglobulin domain-containing protein n=1 Tax=Gillisia limnaea (strain DSM 15749 / LMG 21470 / R-8282) TaxID=865937 RepID=H2BX37_GILLR|nr:T9SS type A sorting domain-containing protein [Gillisia limnaea]EHQ01989.1 hypothetical protein Gilli_1323 [Gillisia limnaea DSM 15749]
MEKKLLSLFLTVFFIFLSFWSGFGQCPTSVGVTASPGTTICAGESITFTANPTGGSLPQYQWQINGSNVNGENLSTYTTTSLTNGQKVRVIVTSSSTDQSNCPVQSSEVPVTVNPIRTATAIIAANNSNICPGQTVNFTISSQNNIGSGSQYEWRVNGTSQGTSNTFSSNNLVAGDQIQLWVDSSVPCTDPVLSNTISITEKPGTPAVPSDFTSSETAVCPGVIQTYTVPNDPNASEYIWTYPSGWTGSSTTNSVTVTSGNSGSGTITVKAKNSCGTSEARSLAVSVKAGTPATPGTISGTAQVCPGISQTFSIAAVTGATSYEWTFPTGWTGSSTSTSITLTPTVGTAVTGNLSVTATNDCGTSSARPLAISVKSGTPDQPAAFTAGPATLCPGTEGTYSVPIVAGATQYIWTLPTGFSASSLTTTTPSLVVTAGTSGSGNITVKASNDCGTGPERFMAISINPPKPVITGEIAGSTGVCASTTSLSYSIPAIANATSYEWAVNGTGWQITAGAGTNQITVSSGTTGGTISVIAKNSCGDSASKSITVNLNPPPPVMAGEISGPSNVCAGSTGNTYSIPTITGASSYTWTRPSGWSITGGENSNTITVTAGTLGGNISVTAVNGCGSSTTKTFPVTTTAGVPDTPGTITSSLDSNPNICPPKSGVTFTVPTVTGATGYEWSLPAGWEITSEANIASIIVNITANAAYQNEVVSVRARNACGLGPARSYSNITVSNFIIADLGADQLVCRSRTELSIPVELYFGNSNRLKPTWSSNGNGTFRNLPDIGGGNSTNNIPRNFTIYYTPSANDITKEFITITMTVPPPQSSSPCGTGKDEMRIYFRNSPTATIASPAAICTGSSTTLNITGTPNSKVTYSKGNQTGLTVDIGSSGTATIPSGPLTDSTDFILTGITNTDAPICSNSLNSIATVSVTQKPTAVIFYTGPYCNSMEESTGAVTIEGEYSYLNGTFSATGDLASEIDLVNGSFIPSEIQPGTYTVTYTTPVTGICEVVTATTEVTITPLPTAIISYESSPFCSSDAADKLVTLTGTHAYTGGTYSSTSGLDINASTGIIKAANSQPDTYTVTYTLPAASGCGIVTATTDVTITKIPVPNISYTSGAICKEDSSTYSPTIAGTGLVNGGSFSAPSGLSIITSTGVIDATSSTPGTYKITYTLPAADGCGQITAETEVTITPVPSVDISYDGPYCESTSGTKQVVFTNGIGAFENGSFNSSPSGLEINTSSGAITPSASEPGEYTVIYNIPASGGCGVKTAETTVSITPVPKATINYNDAPFCTADASSYQVTFTNTTGSYENGTFSGTTGLVIDATTGAINPDGSTPGSHTVTYTIPTAEGCDAVTTTVDITVYREVSINSQPFNIGTCTGEGVDFEVSAAGEGLSYQWYKGSFPGSPISGATSNIYNINSVTSQDDGIYYVEVSGTAPCEPVRSDEVTLNVDENIIVAVSPQDENICLNGDVTLFAEASANGGNVTYQWRLNGNDLTGENNPSLILINVQSSQAGEYSVYIEGPQGYTCSSIETSAAILTVYDPPTVDAGPDLEICSTETSIALAGAIALNHTSLIWTSTGGGQISNPTDLSTATYSPVSADLGTTIIFTLTALLEVDGVQICTDAVDTKEITIIPQPVLTAFTYTSTLTDTATEFCETDTAAKSPTIEGNNLANGTGVFTVDKPALVVNATSGAFTPNGTDPGVYIITYTFTATSNSGVCAEVSRDFTVTIGANPVADFSYDSEIYCKDTRDNTFNTAPIISFDEAGHENVDSFIADNSGLVLDTATGAIDLSGSSAGTYIITRTIDYKDSAEDGCQPVTAEFTITINDRPIPDFSYSATEFCSDPAAPLSIEPTLETGAVKGIFTYTATPQGANLVLDSASGAIDITTSDAGEYEITNTVDVDADGCDTVNDLFIITINKRSDATFSYTSPSYCITSGNAVVAAGYETGGTFSSATLGSLLNSATGAISWSSSSGVAGSHQVIYKIEGKGVCEDVEHTTSVTIDPLPKGGKLIFQSIVTPDNDGRIFIICEDNNPGYADPLSLLGSQGQVYKWRYRGVNDTSWSVVENDEGEDFTGASLSGAQIEAILNGNLHEGELQTTVFRVELSSGACSPNQFSETGIVSVIPSNIEPTPVEIDPTVICFGENVSLYAETGYETGGAVSGGQFNSANSLTSVHGWRVRRDGSTADLDFPASGNNTKPNIWSNTNDKPFYTANINGSGGSDQRWDSGDKKFAIVTGNNKTTLETSVFAIDGIDQAILTFDQAYNLTAGASIRIEISTNGGASYESVPLYEVTGPAASGNIGNFGGSTADVNNIRIDLGNYIGNENVRIRFHFLGARDGDIWALDEIDIPNGPRGVELEWTDYTDPDDPVFIGNETTETWTPTQIGLNTFVVKTMLTTNSNGQLCDVIQHEESVEVFVYDTYTSTPTAAAIACGTNQVGLTSSVTGGKQGAITSYPTADGFIGHWEIIASPSGYVYDVAQWSGGITNTTAVFTPNIVGTYTLNWVLELEDETAVSECENTINDVTFTIFDQYTSSATAAVEACGDNSVELTGLLRGLLQGNVSVLPTTDGTYGEWQVKNGPDGYVYDVNQFSTANTSISAINDPAAIFSPDLVGEYTLRWAIVNENNTQCEHTVTDVTITIYDLYTSTASAVLDTCETNSFNLTATVSGTLQESVSSFPTADGTTGKWEVISNPNEYTFAEAHFSGINDPNAVFTPIVLGEYTLQWTLINANLSEECIIPATVSFKLFDSYTLTAEAEAGSCGDFAIQLTGTTTGIWQETISYPTQDDYIGQWRVEGGAGNFSNQDPTDVSDPVNNPNAIFTAEALGNYTFIWELVPDPDYAGEFIENTACPAAPAEIAVEIQECIALDFDGVNDYVDLGTGYSGAFSYEAWIRPFDRPIPGGGITDASDGTIISGPGFEINMENLPDEIIKGTRWYHIAVTTTGNLFVDGIPIAGSPKTTGGQASTLIGARLHSTTGVAENHFSGWIEEIRIWNGDISQDQIRFLMNQRLQNTTNIGVEIPMPAPGLSFSALAGYYQLLAVAELIEGGITPNLALNQQYNPGLVRNMETLQENTAPLPYTSATDNVWSNRNTWTQPVVWDFPNSKGIDGSTPIEWNIVRTSNNITSGGKDITVLGLISESGELTIMDPNDPENEYNGGQSLRVTHYLRLDGGIDLVGESQLLQDMGSIVDPQSSGWLERDQQGTANSYNYNYWSFPVSAGASNAGGTIKGLLRDGTDSNNAKDISFAYDHTYADKYNYNTEQKRISAYWLFKFFGTANVYAEWKWIGENGQLNTGDGFTMKGTSGDVAISTPQNYVFKGLPNNGPVNGVSIGSNQNRLVGNPYPSALNAVQFILDNLNSANVGGATNTENIFNGALYFWDHFGQENTHILREYVGGYATINLSGAVKSASSVDERINNDGTSGTKKPGQFVPVGQGFFINTVLDPAIANGIIISGGIVNFNNSQRAFVTELNPNESQFLKPIYPTKGQKSLVTKDSRYKIRLDFTSPLGFHRQILVTADANTTNSFDLGYDALLFDNIPEDMYWLIQDKEFVIQAVPNFDKDQILPLGIKIKEEGELKIEIGGLENYPDTEPVYLKDILNDSIHDLRKSPYFSTSEPGTIHDRFEIIFFKDEPVPPVVEVPGEEPDEIKDRFGISVRHGQTDRELQILNPQELSITNMYIFDLNGNKLEGHNNLPIEKEFKMPVRNYSSGVYIVQLVVEGRVVSKKIIINN